MSGFEQMATELAERVEELVEIKLQAVLDEYCKASIRIVFSDEEAAEFLKCRVEDVQEWTRRGYIAYARYPKSRGDGLGRKVTYDLAALLDFRERHIVRNAAVPMYKIDRTVPMMGPKVIGKAA